MKEKTVDFGKDPIAKILFRLAPPVMLAQLIQALYNIVDSFFVGRNSESGLTALSIVYPLQLLMIALAVGTGVGINTLMAHFSGLERKKKSGECGACNAACRFVMDRVCPALLFFFMPADARVSTKSADVIRGSHCVWADRLCVQHRALSESGWTKVLQAEGDMSADGGTDRRSGCQYHAGSGADLRAWFFVPKMGIAGAAVCDRGRTDRSSSHCHAEGLSESACGFYVEKIISNVFIIWAFRIYWCSLLIRFTFSVWTWSLKGLLRSGSDNVGTVLQVADDLLIPLGAMQTCIVPVISYNYGAGDWNRCHKTVMEDLFIWHGLYAGDKVCSVLKRSRGRCCGSFRRWGSDSDRYSCISHYRVGLAACQLTDIPVFFQAVGSFFRVPFWRQSASYVVCLFVLLGYAFSPSGFDWFWLTFPARRSLQRQSACFLYRKFLQAGKIMFFAKEEPEQLFSKKYDWICKTRKKTGEDMQNNCAQWLIS